MSTLNIAITYNRLFRNMAYASCSSLKDNKRIFVHLNYVDISTKDNEGFKSSSWYQCLNKKMLFADKKFDEMDYEEILCIADSDIYYFNSEKILQIKEYMETKNLSLIGASENYPQYTGYINCGFFFVKKNEQTKDFFKTIIKTISENDKLPEPKKGANGGNIDEQDILNDILKKNLNYEVLSPIEFPMGCYIDDVIRNKGTDQIALVHATCAANFQEKKEQLNRVLHLLNHKPIKWFRVPLEKKEIALYIDGKIKYDSREKTKR